LLLWAARVASLGFDFKGNRTEHTMNKLKLHALLLAALSALLSCTASHEPTLDDAFTMAHDGAATVIELEIDEPLRRRRALEILGELRQNDAQQTAQLSEIIRQRKELNLDYDTTRAEFVEWEASLTALRLEYRSELQRLFSDLKAVLTTREWEAVWVAFSTELQGMQGWRS
jgi:hypothetical protein